MIPTALLHTFLCFFNAFLDFFNQIKRFLDNNFTVAAADSVFAAVVAAVVVAAAAFAVAVTDTGAT